MNTMLPAPARPLSAVPFEFLNAKLRARRSRLYEGDRLRELAREGSVHDLALRLYPREDIPSRLELERRMGAACFSDLASIADYLHGDYLAVYSALLRRYPTENLKVLLRLGDRVAAEPSGSGLLIDLPRGISPPVGDLSAGGDVAGFVRRIPLPTVRAAAIAALPLYEQTGSRALLEMAFDKGHWTGVNAALGGLSARDRRACAGPVRLEAAAMRLLATLRAARVYEMPWEQLEAVLLPGSGLAGDDALRRIHADPDPEYVLEGLPWLRRMGLRPEQVADTGGLEEVLWREAVRLANRQYYAPSDGPAVLISYFYLKRSELHNLLWLTQMLQYGHTEREILEEWGA